jgi:hypothetical protein
MQPNKFNLGTIDTARIEKISFYNRFTSDVATDSSDMFDNMKTETSFIFTLPSYFNHACVGEYFQSNYKKICLIFSQCWSCVFWRRNGNLRR